MRRHFLGGNLLLTKFLKISFLLLLLSTVFSANASYPFVFGGVNDKNPNIGVDIDSNSDNPECMAIGGNGFLYVGGDFIGDNINFSANFNVATSLVTSALNDTNSAYTDDGFIAAYNANTQLQWVVALQGAGTDKVSAITADDTGNTYVTGSFRSTHNSDMTVNRISTMGVVTPLGDYSTADNWTKAYIMKLSQTGALLWFKVLDGNAPNSDSKGQTIAIDKNQNVYVGGEFANVIDFDPSANETVISSAQNGLNDPEDPPGSDAFVMKLTGNGDFVWVKTLGGENNGDEVNQIVVDSANNVLYIGGTLSSDDGGVNMNGSVNTLEFTSTGAADGSGTDSGDDFSFVQKLDATNGNIIWSKAFLADAIDDESESSISSIAVNLGDGSVFVAGSFDSNIDFNPDPNTTNTSQSQGSNDDLFFVKLDTNGVYKWHGTLGNANTAEDTDEGIDAIHFGNNKLYISGDYNGAVQVGSGTAANIAVWANNIPASNGDQDALLLQLNPTDGSFIWARNFGGTAYDTGDSFAQDSSNNVYFAGQFKNTIDLDPSVEVLNKTTQEGNGINGRDAFVVKLSENGGLITNNSQPPIAQAQALWNYVQQGQWSMIDGSASYDLNGETLTFSWRQVKGPRLTMLDSEQNELTFIAPFVTDIVEIVIELVVKNGAYNSQPVLVTFNVGPGAAQEVGTVEIVDSSDGSSLSFIGIFLLMFMAIRRNITSNRKA
ncbi:hypothetical protein L3081_09585 [Colwellia sp. MSW7]|uniref:Uncharacterized protein n=1 Tax=Colwellia maritima TaxID=2912588 RepID=A0ABS9X002_9GAMM|nr:hypothetical protein [Colwellia maritima]MCI2283597.1 hypothetical protein [Colwellia maritima]